MKCPKCDCDIVSHSNANNTARVTRTEKLKNSRIRYYDCLECGSEFATEEKVLANYKKT